MEMFRLEFETDVRGSKGFQESLALEILFPLASFEGQPVSQNDFSLSLTFGRCELFEHPGNLDLAFYRRARVFEAHTANYVLVIGGYQQLIRVLHRD